MGVRSQRDVHPWRRRAGWIILAVGLVVLGALLWEQREAAATIESAVRAWIDVPAL